MEWTPAAKKWQEIFREYESQGLRRKEFCAARGLKKSTFDYWRGRLRKTAAQKAGVVRIASVERSAEPIRVRIGEHVVVELDGHASEEHLARVLNAAMQR